MLGNLVPDVFEEILALLDLSDLRSLRLTCRHLERASRLAFGPAAFSLIKVDFCKRSLTWIHSLASHEHFRFSVRGMIVGRDKEHRRNMISSFGYDGHWPRLKDGGVDPECESVRLFTDVLSRFSNCSEAILSGQRGANEKGEYSEKALSASDALSLLLHAYGVPDAPPLRVLRIRTGNRDFWPDSVPSPTMAALKENWAANLQEFDLDTTIRDDGYLSTILELLTSAPKLKVYRGKLGLDKWDNIEDKARDPGYRFGQHLAGSGLFAPDLQKVLIGVMMWRGPDLFNFVSHHQYSLTRLDLYRLRLGAGSWKGMLRSLSDLPFPKLRRFSIFMCTDGDDDGYFIFCPLYMARDEWEACTGSFEFLLVRVPKGAQHVTGFIFQSSGDMHGMKRALQLASENNERVLRMESRPCTRLQELGHTSTPWLISMRTTAKNGRVCYLRPGSTEPYDI